MMDAHRDQRPRQARHDHVHREHVAQGLAMQTQRPSHRRVDHRGPISGKTEIEEHDAPERCQQGPAVETLIGQVSAPMVCRYEATGCKLALDPERTPAPSEEMSQMRSAKVRYLPDQRNACNSSVLTSIY